MDRDGRAPAILIVANAMAAEMAVQPYLHSSALAQRNRKETEMLSWLLGNRERQPRYDALDDVDPVAEAQVYLAYGRRKQALEVLDQAAAAGDVRASEMASDLRSGKYEARQEARMTSFEASLDAARGLAPSSQAVIAALIRRLAELERAA